MQQPWELSCWRHPLGCKSRFSALAYWCLRDCGDPLRTYGRLVHNKQQIRPGPNAGHSYWIIMTRPLIWHFDNTHTHTHTHTHIVRRVQHRASGSVALHCSYPRCGRRSGRQQYTATYIESRPILSVAKRDAATVMFVNFQSKLSHCNF